MTLKIDQRVWLPRSERYGVIVKILDNGRYSVKIENSTYIVRKHGSALESAGPSPLDWDQPVYTDYGVGPVEMNVNGYGYSIDEATGRVMRYGWPHPENKGDGFWWFEDGTPARGSGPTLVNKEKIMSIDWSKPVHIAAVSDVPTKPGDENARRTVTVLGDTFGHNGETDLVALKVTNLDGSDVIVYRRRDNTHVGGLGSALTFANVPVVETAFIRVSGAAGSECTLHKCEPLGLAVASIELRIEDGIVTEAKLRSSNTAKWPIKVKQL